MYKLKLSREWLIQAAKDEEGHDVSAGPELTDINQLSGVMKRKNRGDMKTVEERADILIQNLRNCILRFDDMDSVDFGIVKTQIIAALKEQDKITRHACAEIVLNQGGKVLNKDIRNDMHRKIINTKSV